MGLTTSTSSGRLLLLLAGLLAALLVITNLASLLLYRAVRREMDAALGERLLSIATTAAETIGPDRFRRLARDGAGAQDYGSACEELRRIAASNDLDNIVLLDPEARSIVDLRGDV